MPSSDKTNHCSIKCVRGMVACEKGARPFLASRCEAHQLDQRLPKNDFVYLLQELAHSVFLHAQTLNKASLFHRSMMLGEAYSRHTGPQLVKIYVYFGSKIID